MERIKLNMKIKNIEVNFNFLDADDMERFEKEANG